MPPRILISAGEASGDRYAAALASALRRRLPEAEFFGCTGVEMRRAGVRQVVDSASLAVVGIVEVLSHIPRIYREYRRLLAAADRERPDLAILTDAPDFHLRVARQLRRRGIPVVYLVAPQVWAWRSGRLKTLRRNVEQLHCIFPFEEAYFRAHGVPARYIGHPLSRLVRAAMNRNDFLAKHGLPGDRPLIALCPGSRRGEVARHLPDLAEACARLAARRPLSFVLAIPAGAAQRFGHDFFKPLLARHPVHLIEGETWDVLAHADLSLVASGTITVEAALLGAPMITFYKVAPATYYIGRMFVDVPFYSMVNLIAGRAVVPELIQHGLSGASLAAAAQALLDNPAAQGAMRDGLAEVSRSLATAADPMERSASLIAARFERN